MRKVVIMLNIIVLAVSAFAIESLNKTKYGLIVEYELNMERNIPSAMLDSMVISLLNYSLSVDSLKMIHMYDYLPHLRKDTISIIQYRDIDYKPYEIEHYSMDSGLTGQYVLYTRSSEIPLRYSKGLSTMMSYKKSAYDILRNKYYKEGARCRIGVVMEVYIDDYEIKGVKWFVIE